jgi:hypothetical protein
MTVTKANAVIDSNINVNGISASNNHFQLK